MAKHQDFTTPKGCVERKGNWYRRFKVKCPITGKWKDEYAPLPHPLAFDFATKLAEAERRFKLGETAAKPAEVKDINALIRLYEPVIEKTANRTSTLNNKKRYLALISADLGTTLVRDVTGGKCYELRDSLSATPGKANSYLSELKCLLQFGVQRDWVMHNVARGIDKLDINEGDPWPAEVVEKVYNLASPMLKQAIIAALCSGARISDIIRMEYEWIKDGKDGGKIMVIEGSVKTNTSGYIPMHPRWLEEIAKSKRKFGGNVVALHGDDGRPAIKGETILKSQFRRAYATPENLQDEVNKLMKSLGLGPAKGRNQYSFHGLSKNAICYLTELGLTVETISAIVGKTPETVRYYAKEAKKWMLAEAAAATIKASNMGGMADGKAARG